jgi:acyl-[acyl-carrier-protein]-phospholipid O-acyltransferase/long-chain-fatty-acid--[acyl-carrier-protein] ligase
MATPTLYRAYLRRIPREDFAHVRLSVSGGEALRDDLADAWLARHGSELLQGYGCTELAPVAAVNVPDVDSLGSLQVNHRRGTVGRAIPGVALAIVDPTTFELLAPGNEGLLLVRGANRMTEYLDDPGATHAAVHDGWYATGDLARIDRDAFLTITGRVARFSKIGGEMVSHVRVEEALSHALKSIAFDATDGAREVEFAVVALPDAAKGERLAIVHTRVSAGVDAWLDALARADLPPLMVPRRASFFEAGALPRLSTGKTDLRAVRELAAALDAARNA